MLAGFSVQYLVAHVAFSPGLCVTANSGLVWNAFKSSRWRNFFFSLMQQVIVKGLGQHFLYYGKRRVFLSPLTSVLQAGVFQILCLFTVPTACSQQYPSSEKERKAFLSICRRRCFLMIQNKLTDLEKEYYPTCYWSDSWVLPNCSE